MKAYVICCNDGVMYVVVGSLEEAQLRLLALKDEDVEKKGLSYERIGEGKEVARLRYERQHYWHIHTVEGEVI